jgi:hypothetical protein
MREGLFDDIFDEAFYGTEDMEILESFCKMDELFQKHQFLTLEEIRKGITWEDKYGKDIT